MIVWGGSSNADTWSSIDDAGAPGGRWSGSWHRNTVWTGCSLIVWGGVAKGGGGITDTGGAFTP